MTAMTMTEKILARHAERAAVRPGDNIWIDVDILMTHDVCGPGTIGIFKKHFGANAKVWDKDKVVIIPDHYIFTADPMANRNVDTLRAFVAEQSLKYYYDVGTPNYKGVCHIALPEEGHTRPGEVLLGTDSHTCTAGAFGVRNGSHVRRIRAHGVILDVQGLFGSTSIPRPYATVKSSCG